MLDTFARLKYCVPVKISARWILALMLLASASLANAKIIRVPQDSPDIYNAVYDGTDGDEIIVGPGIYKGMLPCAGKTLNIHSTDPTNWTVVDSTIIEGSGFQLTLPAVVLSSVPGTSTRLAGFTIRNAGGSGIVGGGPTSVIEYCHILDNTGGTPFYNYSYSTVKPSASAPAASDDRQYGGGIYNCWGTIQNCIIERNYAERGGGLAMCYGTIQNNLIVRNRITDWGGRGAAGAALYQCGGGEGAAIRGNTIVDNGIGHYVAGQPYQWRGGGLVSCYGEIFNNIIWVSRADLTPEYTACPTPSYSCIKGWKGGGTGNITTDPHLNNATFDETPGATNQGHVWPAQDWHLKPDSPCIDAGETTRSLPAVDIEGHQRGLKANGAANKGDGSGVDMGAYEALPKPVAVWIQNGPPDGLAEGQGLDVGWELDLASAGTAINLRLTLVGRVIQDFGNFWNANGKATTKVVLPTPLVPSNGYCIEGRSCWNKLLIGTSPAFTIQGTQKVAVWIQNGPPDGLAEGQSLDVGWEQDLASAGTVINLRLTLAGRVIQDFGNFWNAAGKATTKVVLPASLAPSNGYCIEGRSCWNNLLIGVSAPFAIQDTGITAARGAWGLYR